jgi:23S rRNA G2445 N2-methylase RlmL
MDVFNRSARIIVTCIKRLSPWLEQEIRELGFVPERTFATGVELKGTVSDCIRLNLNLRTASQVLYSLSSFPAHNPVDVYKGVKRIAWDHLIRPDGYLSVTNVVDHPTVNNSMYVNVKVKDAVVDAMREATGARPDSGPSLNGVVVNLFWRDDRAEVFLDTSGETLSKHGYRREPGKAPMLEGLAAATLLASQWDPSSPFVNPMCGSGTVAIEAVLLATNRRPGHYRNDYAFMHLKEFDQTVYDKARREMMEKVREVPGLRVIATDISAKAVEIAKINARRAGVADSIEFKVCDFSETPVPDGPGVVYFNPEYGERLGEIAELEETYGRIGDFMKQKCQGYTGYVFTGNLDLAKKIGLRAKRRIEFFSAKLDCRLLEYELYAGRKE